MNQVKPGKASGFRLDNISAKKVPGIILKTTRFSFKVYDKGAEFRKNDYEKSAKNTFKSYDLQKMVDIADRTLRYECTFRSSYFFYQWMQSMLKVESVQKSRMFILTYSVRWEFT